MQTVEQALGKLEKSRFRSSFHLKAEQIDYIDKQGWETIEKHARDFVRERLAPAYPANDVKQTPMKGHPVFIAQHATGCCCRGCLYKWYRVEQGKPLTDIQQEKIVRLLMAWIRKDYNLRKTSSPRISRP